MHERALLFQFIAIATNTGMRPIEIFQLNWNHLEGFENAGTSVPKDGQLVIIGYGKGKLPSRSIPKNSVLSNFLKYPRRRLKDNKPQVCSNPRAHVPNQRQAPGTD